jgi:hypothetical protein
MRVVKNGINADQVITVAVTTLLVEKKRKEKKRKDAKKAFKHIEKKEFKIQSTYCTIDGWMDG